MLLILIELIIITNINTDVFESSEIIIKNCYLICFINPNNNTHETYDGALPNLFCNFTIIHNTKIVKMHLNNNGTMRNTINRS